MLHFRPLKNASNDNLSPIKNAKTKQLVEEIYPKMKEPADKRPWHHWEDRK